ncbi:NAD-dependent epimerase/dehydratase family protein [Desulfospira joergensenii]|uniref:NAD-dependent epimerase/dehydratase family protein n=1 Tax=Desulfospira joergensenii TaxID=53329 RepID=UPI0003B42FC5|nr:NAD-dependent epimerase/dehydratase family protein [Desulfospira joergensenii]
MTDFYSGKKVLVTGGTGFVGTHFVEALVAAGANVRVPVHRRTPAIKNEKVEYISGNLESLEDCIRCCEGVDYVFHAAGAVSAAGTTVANPMSAISTNLILTARILEAAMIKEIKRILVFSSGTTAYPLADYPIKEEEMWTDHPPEIYFGYGWMRRYIEILSRFVSSKSSIGVAICRPTAVYGRHDDFDPVTSHVIPALIRRAVSKENPFVVWGTGDEIRDFLHVTDLVRGCLVLLEKHAVCDPVNIGYGKTTSIKEIVEIILNAAKHDKVEVQFDDSKPTTIPKRMVETIKAKKILGFEPEISLSKGLEDTFEWYLKQENKDSLVKAGA